MKATSISLLWLANSASGGGLWLDCWTVRPRLRVSSRMPSMVGAPLFRFRDKVRHYTESWNQEVMWLMNNKRI
jgi:hypothetical protein